MKNKFNLDRVIFVLFSYSLIIGCIVIEHNFPVGLFMVIMSAILTAWSFFNMD